MNLEVILIKINKKLFFCTLLLYLISLNYKYLKNQFQYYKDSINLKLKNSLRTPPAMKQCGSPDPTRHLL